MEPQKQANSLNSKRIVITGANTGIGRTAALAIAREGMTMVLAGRSEERTQPVLDALRARGVNAHFVALDLARLSQVREAAAEVRALVPSIDVLINNAGVAGARGVTNDGFELAFGINHVGHYLWTRLLMQEVRRAERSRVVTVASRAHKDARAWDWERLRRPTESVTAIPEYATSKLANVLFSAELARRLGADASVTTSSLHPGVVATDIWRHVPAGLGRVFGLFMRSPESGARTTVHCATSAEAGEETGLYYARCKPQRPSKQARDVALAAELWERSAQWCGLPVDLEPQASVS